MAVSVQEKSGEASARALREVSLDDKYDLAKQQVFLNGTQALVRMLLMQKARDKAAGLNTAGFVSGYRGSPLGGLDQQLFRSKKQLAAAEIVFQPGLNEELAATACWGSQQAELTGEGKYDGVFALWYGKGPGVDRTTDVFRHANMAGPSKHGGVLALMGDDHTAESSTVAHQTEFNFVDTMIPILNPAGVQEMLDYGLYGYALSRFAGTWTALKCVKENVESTASVDGSLDRVKIVLPTDFVMPPGGLNIRHELDFIAQEARLHEYKRAAALAFIKANKLNRIVISGGKNARIGIISIGKSYLDVRQAMDDLGIDEVAANKLGIRVFKVACPWPMDPGELMDFARGLETVIVVEEKRSLIEVQIKEELYGTGVQPQVIGKRDERGDWLFPVKGALDPNDIAIAVGERVLKYAKSDEIAAKVSALRQAQARLVETVDVGTRTPYFCSGCPHNTSTRVPEGSRASAGIGCHYMALWMDRDTVGFTAMGGEGANWVGESHFSKRNHVFQNLGDGTYNHSGVLALRFAVSAQTNVTYKILFNDAVAMTGGQHHEGNLTVDMTAHQVRAEGVSRIAIVTDEPEKYSGNVTFPSGATVHHRSELDAVQRELRDIDGVTVVIYDQTCAAEKRRRRKRGLFPDPDKRVIINELVCEGCGDCGVKSNCVSVQPVETEFGRKRRIDQSSCNKDFSCQDGFCPSFVTVHGAKIKKAEGLAKTADAPATLPPEPVLPSVEKENWACIVTGVGGTGVVTIGAIIGMAAHLEGKGCGMIDMAGLAQKGGSVYSHVKVGRNPDAINAIRVSAEKASLILGGDLVVSGTKKVLAAVRQGKTLFVANTAEVFGGEFTRNADFSLPVERLKRAIIGAAGRDKVAFVDATGLAVALFGNSIAANMFLLGYAHQKGGVPLSSAAIERAIELNGEAVKMNIEAFRWGRRTAHDQAAVEAMVAAARKPTETRHISGTLQEMVDRRAAFLTDYQDAAYARRYRMAVARIQKAELERTPGQTALTDAVARYFFKLMAYKDEYEVARLYTDGSFLKQLQAEFDGDIRLEFHLAPPLLGKKDAQGNPVKTAFGPWMLKAFGVLAKLKRLRGTGLDIFGYSAERRMERQLIGEYEGMIDYVAARLNPANHAIAVGLASVPEKIRGFGHVKERHAAAALAEREALMARFNAPQPAPLPMAAE
ncbi:MAG: indolepyruvate ferredoxin oxidoreductase family protein [Methylocystis sp.]|nr:indolepyruvate ferredoxin oxidoreductase family protein [Methylocystis sp.]MCA3584922.1 indolepyruvate ferredoxin oxidoreductase family protein [Methylocystis sp.]MCA3587236.1 indolepyruvate ferredoxin oxidoreductase family protein [Methylocystis sp.]MCA3591140.1 indolepyruvate ferredoxin oxidoreductase family protein [Methylocystis sp.]